MAKKNVSYKDLYEAATKRENDILEPQATLEEEIAKGAAEWAGPSKVPMIYRVPPTPTQEEYPGQPQPLYGRPSGGVRMELNKPPLPDQNMWEKIYKTGTPEQRRSFTEQIIQHVPEAAVEPPRPDLNRVVEFDDEGNPKPTKMPEGLRRALQDAGRAWLQREYGEDVTTDSPVLWK